MLTFDDAVAALPGGRFEGDFYRAPCPAHGGKDRNLSVWADEDGNAGFKCWSRGCSTKAIVEALAGVNNPHPTSSSIGKTSHIGSGAAAFSGSEGIGRRSTTKCNSKAESTDLALRIWRESKAPEGTIVQDYLFGRGWTGEMPWGRQGDSPASTPRGYAVGLAIPASIRFHPRLRHSSGAYLPAMVAGIEDREGEIVGIHRTFLKADGTGKAEVEPQKMALGRAKGCAAHLAAGAPELVLCEGIETGLSILQATGRHVWVALGTANLGQVELPSFVREVIIAADADEPGMRAAQGAAEQYRAHGYQVRIVPSPSEHSDWNDVLMR